MFANKRLIDTIRRCLDQALLVQASAMLLFSLAVVAHAQPRTNGVHLRDVAAQGESPKVAPAGIDDAVFEQGIHVFFFAGTKEECPKQYD